MSRTMLFAVLMAAPVLVTAQSRTDCYAHTPQSVSCTTTPGIQAPSAPRSYTNPSAATDAFHQTTQALQTQRLMQEQSALLAEQRRALEQQRIAQELEQQASDALLEAETAIVRMHYARAMSENLELPPDEFRKLVIDRATATLGRRPDDLAYAQAAVQCLFRCE